MPTPVTSIAWLACVLAACGEEVVLDYDLNDYGPLTISVAAFVEGNDAVPFAQGTTKPWTVSAGAYRVLVLAEHQESSVAVRCTLTAADEHAVSGELRFSLLLDPPLDPYAALVPDIATQAESETPIFVTGELTAVAVELVFPAPAPVPPEDEEVL